MQGNLHRILMAGVVMVLLVASNALAQDDVYFFDRAAPITADGSPNSNVISHYYDGPGTDGNFSQGVVINGRHFENTSYKLCVYVLDSTACVYGNEGWNNVVTVEMVPICQYGGYAYQFNAMSYNFDEEPQFTNPVSFYYAGGQIFHDRARAVAQIETMAECEFEDSNQDHIIP